MSSGIKNILLVEDDMQLATDIKQQLQSEGYAVEHVYDGLLAERRIIRDTPDFVILDVNIPGKNGYEICASVRAQGFQLPILMLTAFGELDDKIEGFDKGADDYMTKPFFFKELLARIKVLAKRSAMKYADTAIVIDDLELNCTSKMVVRAGQHIKLTPREFDILEMLARANGQLVLKKDLIARVWGTSVDVNTNTIEVFISFLRNKIDKGFDSKLIHTRPGFGYYLMADK